MTREDFNYSDEMLNAYLDNELAGEERKRLIEDLRDNDGLRQRVCRLEQVRNMVSIAYHDIPDPKGTMKTKYRGFSSFTAVAASIMIIVGIVGGWLGHSYLQKDNSLVQLADSIQVNDPANTARTWRVLLHVASNDQFRLNALLEETENILKQYENKKQKVSIQILVNGKGLNLLRSKNSPYGKRIASLKKRYKNITFVACARALNRLKQEKGIDLKLVPEAQVVPSALREVLQRQKEGWTYIKI